MQHNPEELIVGRGGLAEGNQKIILLVSFGD